MADYPEHLVDVVRNELREFSASDADVGELITEDARRILSKLSELGATFPEPPKPWWVVSADGTALDVRAGNELRLIVRDGTGQKRNSPEARQLLHTVCTHLNAECVSGEETDRG